MSFNILIVETNREAAVWLQDRLESGLTDVLASVAFNTDDALQQLSDTKFDLVFFTDSLNNKHGDRSGLRLVTHIARHSMMYNLPRAAWIHSPNKVAAVIISGQLEQVCIPTHIHSLEWCKTTPTEFINTVQDILLSVPKEISQPTFLLH